MRDVLTRQQALARGITASAIRHRLARGTWRRLHPGVYLTHGGDLTWRHRVTAAVLARGDGAVVSLECALRLWNLENREPPIITLAEPTTTHRVRPLPGVRVRRRRRLATARRYDIPVTSLPQTLLDVLAQPGRTTDDAMALVTRAVVRRRVTVAALREELTHHPRHPRRTLLEEVFRAADDGLESVAEARYVKHVEQPHGLPTMQRQVAVDGPAAVADGRSRRLDFWDEERGRHGDRRGTASDRCRTGRATVRLHLTEW